MSLNKRELEWFEGLLAAYNESARSVGEWRQKFMNDQLDRFEKHGPDIHFSLKQWNILYQVADDVGYERPDGE